MKFNFRIRPYKDRDFGCMLHNVEHIPRVACFDTTTWEKIPVPLVSAWQRLWTYVICDEEWEQPIMPVRFCKALIALMMTRISAFS